MANNKFITDADEIVTNATIQEMENQKARRDAVELVRSFHTSYIKAGFSDAQAFALTQMEFANALQQANKN